jgi:hypothetical protein
MHMYTSFFRTHVDHVFTAEFAFYSELVQHKHIVYVQRTQPVRKWDLLWKGKNTSQRGWGQIFYIVTAVHSA